MNNGTIIDFISLHVHGYYRTTNGLKPADFLNKKFISDRTILSLILTNLVDENVSDVIGEVRSVLSSS